MVSTLSTRTLGDVVSDTWRIYKDNFWKIVGISAIVQIPATIIVAVMFLVLAGTGMASGFFDEPNPDPAVFFSGSFVALLVVFTGVLMAAFAVMFIVMEGAVTHAVCQQYVWQPISVRLAFRRFWPMLGAILIAFLAVFLMAITIIGIPFAIYFGLRWYFVLQVSLLEDASPVEALRGSSELVEGNWWRVLGITFVLSFIISAVTFLPSFVPIIGPIIVNILAWPAYTIVKTLLYCDLRLRADGAEQFNEVVLAVNIGLAPVDEEEGWSKFDPA